MDSEGNAHQKNEDSRFSEVDSEVLKIYLSHHITSMILCFSKGLLVLFFLLWMCVCHVCDGKFTSKNDVQLRT